MFPYCPDPSLSPHTNTDSDFMGRQYCAMALGNLAAEPENHEDIVKLDGINSLISLLKSEEVEASRYAAFALSNLAANANHRQQIVDEGAIDSLIQVACCEDPNAQRQALAALRGICISPQYRVQCVRLGVLDPLALMSRTEEKDILREVAAALNCLSCMEENKEEVSSSESRRTQPFVLKFVASLCPLPSSPLDRRPVYLLNHPLPHVRRYRGRAPQLLYHC